MAKLSITLKIAGTSYPYPDIDSSQEELYRHAEREVNRLFAGSEHPTLLPKDRLALVALHLAMENIALKASRALGEEAARLLEIERRMNDYLLSTETKKRGSLNISQE
jgi:hypothetical protein